MRKINPQIITNKIISFLQAEFQSAGFKKGIIALSGGVDSSTATCLATRALGSENLYVVLLPYKNWHEEALDHAKLVIKKLKIPQKNVITLDIAPLIDSYNHLTIKPSSHLDRVRLGNLMARMRMAVLYDLAKAHDALVIGTENRSEYYLGYFTRFGDEASDIEPIRSLYKTEVYQLARYLSVPEPILTKAPTAGLWEGQTDEGEFGFSYKDADPILYHLYDLRRSLKAPKSLIKRIQARVAANDFKHHLPKVCEL